MDATKHFISLTAKKKKAHRKLEAALDSDAENEQSERIKKLDSEILSVKQKYRAIAKYEEEEDARTKHLKYPKKQKPCEEEESEEDPITRMHKEQQAIRSAWKCCGW